MNHQERAYEEILPILTSKITDWFSKDESMSGFFKAPELHIFCGPPDTEFAKKQGGLFLFVFNREFNLQACPLYKKHAASQAQALAEKIARALIYDRLVFLVNPRRDADPAILRQIKLVQGILKTSP